MPPNLNLRSITAVTLLRMFIPLGDNSFCVDITTPDVWKYLKNATNF